MAQQVTFETNGYCSLPVFGVGYCRLVVATESLLLNSGFRFQPSGSWYLVSGAWRPRHAQLPIYSACFFMMFQSTPPRRSKVRLDDPTHLLCVSYN